MRGIPGRERTRQASARLTPAEHDAWIRAAHESGHRELGPWIREICNAAIGQPTPGRPPIPVINRDAYMELSRLGNNTNQIAHWANVHQQLPELKMLAELAYKIRSVIDVLVHSNDRKN